MISCSVLLRLKNVADRSCRENQNTHFVFSNFFLESRAVYGLMWKKKVERDRPHDSMAYAYCMLDT